MQIRTIRMAILTIQKGFEAFECKFEPFEGIQSIPIQIQTIRKGFEAFKYKFEPFERHSKHLNANCNHSNQIRSIRMQIRTL